MYLNIMLLLILGVFGKRNYQVALVRLVRNLLKSYLFMKGIEVRVYDATTDELIGVFDSVAIASDEYGVS